MKQKAMNRPEAKDVIDTLVEAMHKGIEHFSKHYSLVPAEFEVLLHKEAYKDMQPIFENIEEQAKLRLDGELERLNRKGFANRVRRAATWTKQRTRKDWLRNAIDVLASAFRPMRYELAQSEWILYLGKTLNEQARIDYIAVLSELAARASPNMGGPRTRRLTVRNLDGNYDSRRLSPKERVSTRFTDFRTDESTADFASSQSEGADEDTRDSALARLTYEDDEGRGIYMMTNEEIGIGREGKALSQVQLQLKTQDQVSREHVRLRFVPGKKAFQIKDISKYGTIVKKLDRRGTVLEEHSVPPSHWELLPAKAKIRLGKVITIDFESLI